MVKAHINVRVSEVLFACAMRDERNRVCDMQYLGIQKGFAHFVHQLHCMNACWVVGASEMVIYEFQNRSPVTIEAEIIILDRTGQTQHALHHYRMRSGMD
jgi:hypothetical protein